jgi:hypothetical protein
VVIVFGTASPIGTADSSLRSERQFFGHVFRILERKEHPEVAGGNRIERNSASEER